MKALCNPYLVTSLIYLLLSSPTKAQLIPDQSLGRENSLVKSTNNLKTIEGGAIRGNNLFHSFQEFNINANQEVFFNNPNNIQSIFTRVTGGNISNINGLISNVGQADLFILNPAGIIFGENAQLNIGGSFFATTAESILFTDDTKFGVNNITDKPLLTVSTPIGLGLPSNPAHIINRAALKVNPNHKITLAGGNVELDSGDLEASGGKIQLGGLGTEGIIRIKSNGDLVFPNNIILSNILLINDASVNVFGNGGGDIVITGQNIIAKDGSALFAGINNSKDSINATQGDIVINGIDRVVFDGVSKINSNNPTLAINQVSQQGKAGNIEISTNQLDITNGARLINITFGLGDTGNIIINAEKKVNIDSSGSAIFNTIFMNGKGNSGDIKINTQVLSLTNGAQITENIFKGEGNLGNVIINAKEKVNIDGSGSAIFNTIFPGKGKGGNIEINTQFLTLTNGARISANLGGDGKLGDIIINAIEKVSIDGKTSNPLPNNFAESAIFNTLNDNGIGDGGTIEIHTKNLYITKEGRLFTSNLGTGNAGNVTINAQNNVNINNGNILSEVGFNEDTGRIGQGNGGTIKITTDTLTVKNQGSLSVSSKGNGDIGQILVNANLLELKNKGFIQAETNFENPNNFVQNSNKNNIVINVDGNLILQDNSLISAKATEQANGGNVAINADFIIALPQNNDIIASAQEGEGGNIRITSSGIFGIEFRDQATSLSDITASSEFGLDGDVSIDILEIDPAQSLTKLPTQIRDGSELITKGCLVGVGEEDQNEFVVTGRGGLPANPYKSLRGVGLLSAEWVTLSEEVGVQALHPNGRVGIAHPTRKIVEAQGWVIAENGNVILTAAPIPKATGKLPWSIAHNCHK